MDDIKLGRLYIPDERDANFPMKAVLPLEVEKIRTYAFLFNFFREGFYGF